MTWASASGGGGEKIGEVRMFVGRDNIPAGWEEVGLSVPDTFDNVWSVGPSLLRESAWYGIDSNGSNLYTHSVAMVGTTADAAMLFTATPYSPGGTAPVRTANLSTGVLSSIGAARFGSYPNIAETLPNGNAFFSGGFSTTSNAFTNATLEITPSGVVITRAASPVTSGAGSGGYISADEIAFFGSGTGSNAGTRSNASYAYNIHSNTWRQLADCPAGVSGAKVIYFGTKAYIIGASIAPEYRTVWEYDVTLNTYTDSGWVWPGSTTGVRGVGAAKLPSGKYLIFCGATESGSSGSASTSSPRAFVVGPSGPEYEVILPTRMFGTFAMLVPNGQTGLPAVLIKRASAASVSTVDALSGDGTYLFEENSFEFISKSAIVYARKLP